MTTDTRDCAWEARDEGSDYCGGCQEVGGGRPWATVRVAGGELPGAVVTEARLPAAPSAPYRHTQRNRRSNPYGASDAEIAFLRTFEGVDESVKIGYILRNAKFIPLEVKHFIEELELKFLRSLGTRKRGLSKADKRSIDLVVLICRRGEAL